MSDKGVAGLVAFVAITPLIALCCLGPAVLSGGVVWLAGLFGGVGGPTMTLIAVVVGGLVYWLVRRNRRRSRESANATTAVSEISEAGIKQKNSDPAFPPLKDGFS